MPRDKKGKTLNNKIQPPPPFFNAEEFIDDWIKRIEIQKVNLKITSFKMFFRIWKNLSNTIKIYRKKCFLKIRCCEKCSELMYILILKKYNEHSQCERQCNKMCHELSKMQVLNLNYKKKCGNRILNNVLKMLKIWLKEENNKIMA